MEATLMNKNETPFNLNEVMDLNPKQLLLKVYDFALVGCENRDAEKANSAISQLISSLSFNREETNKISGELLRLYEFCMEETEKGNFEIAAQILGGLRESWTEIFNAN